MNCDYKLTIDGTIRSDSDLTPLILFLSDLNRTLPEGAIVREVKFDNSGWVSVTYVGETQIGVNNA